MPTSIAAAILQATNSLRKAGISEARLQAGSLMGHTLQRDRSFILAHADDSLTQEQENTFDELLAIRLTGKPLQYITGHQEFYGLDFEVNSDVLIPRPETELLIETALKLMVGLEGPPIICDVGTGSGCIAITLLHELREFPDARVMALDISKPTLRVAERNAVRHSVASRIDFMLSNCFAALNPRDQLFDLIVSNPPYVSESALEHLQREVKDFEPRSALEAGVDGLSVVRRLVAEAPRFLKPAGHLVFEIGFDQAEAVRQLIDSTVWRLLDIHLDLQGIPRTVSLKKLR